jgi:hypothetical protein
VQFWGACIPDVLGSIWKAKVENKCRFFMWLILQDRLPTADRIIGRGGQANPTCRLCKAGVESSFHMMAACSSSLQVWDQIAQHNSFQMVQTPAQPGLLTTWWKNLSQAGQAQPKEHLQAIIYTTWNLWKERCRRVLYHKEFSVDQLVAIIKNDISNFRVAHETDVV